MRFVAGDFPLSWHTNRTREQASAPVASIANALGNPCAPREPRGLEGILQEHSNVKLFATQFACEPFSAEPASMNVPKFVAQDAIGKRLPCEKIGHGRPRPDAYLGAWPCPANAFQCGNRHHRVADPVRGAHQNFHCATPFVRAPTVAMSTPQNSSGTTDEILQQYAGIAV